jgi:bifunctional DNA-binding transcriptional regulator/antitoxin component of YhaV-PrlF toxin-antitoxin module
VHVNLHEDELAVAGMDIGDEVFVRVRDGKIIIQKADPDDVEHEF